jgi:DNA polymerase-1
MAGKHKVIDWLLEIRGYSKLKSTFLDGVLKYADENDRIHPAFNMTGTVNGRTACSAPGVHNVPRDTFIRNAFIASPGHKLVVMDVKGSELRILVHESGDEELKKIIESGEDFHDTVARRLFNIPKGKGFEKDERTIAKNVTFGVIYGRGPRSIATALNMPYEEALSVYNHYFQVFPTIRDWMDNIHKRMRQQGYVRSPFGRLRRIPTIDHDKEEFRAKAERQAQNSPIAGGSADYLYIILKRMWKRCVEKGLIDKGVKFVHTIHDSIIFDVPERYVDVVADMIKVETAKPPKKDRKPVLNIDMEAEVEVDDEWGGIKPSEEVKSLGLQRSNFRKKIPKR